MRRNLITCVGLVCLVSLLSCEDRHSSVLPATPLGRFAVDWLAAHNRAEAHAMVHFTLVHQGTVRMTGAQVDSAVLDGVKFARAVGRLVPLTLLQSSDTALAVLLRAANADTMTAVFTPVTQPNVAQVLVRVERVPSGHD